MHLLPDPFALPFLEIAVDGAMRRQVMGEHLPLAPRSLHIENAIENFSESRLRPDVQTLWATAAGVGVLPTLHRLSH